MAIPGRKPKPTAVKILEGNPGKRPLNTAELQPSQAKTRRMPHGLSRGAKKLWRRLASDLVDLGIMTDVDIPAFMLAAEHFGIARGAATIIAEDGMVTTDENGFMRKHPLLQVLRDNSAAFRQYATEFGLTPSSRSRLHVDPPEQLSLVDMLFGEVVGAS